MAGIAVTNVRNDPKFEALLPAVNKAILSYSGRDFTTSPPVTEERIYQYDHSGMLDIDDAVSITSVTVTVPWGADYTLREDEYLAQPPRRDDSPVFWYIYIPGFALGSSPEMGFTRNADVSYEEGRWRAVPSTVKVVASWGWAAIPEDVKMAAKWTLDDWVARRPETAAPAEAIESFSRSFGGIGRQGEALSMAIPYRSRDLLAAYTKVMI